jgi:hypothetical protein
MHGRYYGSSIQSSESQQQPQPLQGEQTVQMPIANNSFVSSDAHQSQQQMSTQASMATEAPVTAPAPISAQPEMPTPVTGSSIIDATSSAISTTTPVEQEAGMGASGNVHGRVSLLNSALSCNLPGFLVDQVLENPALPTVKDPTSTKVHAVALLKLLASDPAYGAKIGLMLDNMEAWEKYKLQDHSLFITGAEQKTDYFLLDQGGANSTKLLTVDKSKTDDDNDDKSDGKEGEDDAPEISEAQERNGEGTEAEKDGKDKPDKSGGEKDGAGEAAGKDEGEETELD